MAERGYIPGSPECGRWETLLADALDGQLRPEDEAAFTGHMAICPACAALFEEARRGREWLEFLSPEPEIPQGLLDRILAQTGPGQVAGYGLVAEGIAVPAMSQPWPAPGFAGPVRRHAEPRLLMTVAMAFFSIALTLNLVGFKFTEVKLSTLRPSAVRSLLTRRIVAASIPILRYYDHLRFLYEVESSMPQLTPSEGQSESAPKPADPISAAPDFRQKGTGFSLYTTGVESMWVLAPEELAPRAVRMLRLFPATYIGRSWLRYAHYGSSATRASKRSRLWTA